MQTMWLGLKGWTKMTATRGQAAYVVDGSITVVATLLVFVTWTLLR